MLKKLATLSLIVISCSLTGCGNPELGTFTPSAPDHLRAATSTGTGGTTSVLLTWDATKSTIPNQGATFNVYRGTSASGTITGKVKIAQGVTDTFFTDSSLPVGTSSYQVTATIYDLQSGPSNEVTVTRQAPSTAPLAGTSSAGVNNLSWAAPAGASSYLLYRGTASGSLVDKVPLKALDAGTTTFTDTSVSVGSTYYYQLVIRYSNGNSQTLSEVAVTVQ